jgi:FtsP/CotA-like multicopper oxidase with cupredoxin domain
MRRALASAVALATAACGTDEPVGSPQDGVFLESPREALDLDPSPDVLHVELRAAPFLHHVAGRTLEGFAYNGQTPGPTLRARIGDRLVVDFQNDLAEPTTIHWHGVHVPYAMDGVTWQRQPIEPGATFRFEFDLKHSGTFWYHPHFDSTGQVNRGLYGVLIVEDPDEPVLEDELVLVFDRWGEHEAEAAQRHGADASARHLASEPAFDQTSGPGNGSASLPPSIWTVNGLVTPTFRARGGRRVRVRLLNASNVGYLDLHWPAIRQIAGDQGLLPRLLEPDRILLTPGDRAEVEWLVGERAFTVDTAPYSLFGRDIGQPAALIEVVATDPRPSPVATAWPFAHGEPSADPGSTDVVYSFSGDLHTNDWRINGEKFPDVTIASLPLGAEAVIEVRNVSPTDHPFHVHGHAFEVLSVNGVAPDRRTVEDTWNLAIRDIARLRLVADNPGEWMAHCHILPHADNGMMTVLRVGDSTR